MDIDSDHNQKVIVPYKFLAALLDNLNDDEYYCYSVIAQHFLGKSKKLFENLFLLSNPITQKLFFLNFFITKERLDTFI